MSKAKETWITWEAVVGVQPIVAHIHEEIDKIMCQKDTKSVFVFIFLSQE